MTRAQAEDESAVRELVDRRRRHGDRRGAPHEHARDTRAEQDPPRHDGAGAEDRELVTPVAFGDPRRLVAERLGELHALDDVGIGDLDTEAEIVAINRKGEIEEGQRSILSSIEGIVLLDGTWSQAKALWWRNAWMLKCQRVILGPKHPSRYGQLRKEPRRDGLSTIEAAGMLLGALERRPDITATLDASFGRMLARYRQVQRKMPELAPKPKKRDFRRRKKG